MAAIIGLDDERPPGARRRRPRPTASSASPTATRPARSWSAASGRPSRRPSASRRSLGAKRAIELPVSVAAHSPLMADAAAGMRDVLAGITFRDPEPPLLANADARLITTAEGCRAELVDHLTTGVDWVGAVQAMTAAGRHHLHRGRARPGPHRPHQAHRPRCARPRARRPRGGRPPRDPLRRHRRRRRLATPTATRHPNSREEPRAPARLHPPRRRHRPRRHQPRRQRQGHRLAEPGQRRVRPARDHQVRHHARTPTRPPARSRDFDATDVDGPQGRPPQRARHVVRRRGRQAGRRGRGPRDHGREPRGHRRRVRHRRRRPDADDRQLARAAGQGARARRADLHRERPRGLHVGHDRDRDRRHRPQHVHRHRLLHGHQLRRRGRRADPPRRRPHRDRRLVRDAAARGGARRLRQHARPGLAARGDAARPTRAARSTGPATASSWARAAAA